MRALDLAAGASFGVHWRVDGDTAVGQTYNRGTVLPRGPPTGAVGCAR